jgi:hypothetical protein
MADVFGFNSRDAEDLIASIGGGDKTERLNFGGGGGEEAPDWGVIIKTPVGGIAQRASTTVYSASCDVFSIVGSTLTDTTVNIDVFNISLGAVAGEIFGTAKREYASGKWIIDLEDCT